MSINITKLINAINVKVANADSSDGLVNLVRAQELGRMANDARDVQTLPSYNDFYTADSTNEGEILYAASEKEYYVSIWDKWMILTDSATGTLSQSSGPSYSFQGSTSGYTSGGIPTFNIIDKFPFASNANATDVGDLTTAKNGTTGQSSADNGYTSGGYDPGAAAVHNVIDNFPFASDGNASDVGDLTSGRYNAAGQSSSSSGYTSGGSAATTPFMNIVDKFPFASN